jgi:hypothetical protein
MTNYLVSFQRIAALLLIIFLGTLGRKTGLITERGQKDLVNILLYFNLPAMILTSTNLPQTAGALPAGILAVTLGLLIRLLSLLLGQAVGKLSRWSESERAVFTFQMIFGNAGFIGLPVCLALYGKQGAFLGAMFNLSHDMLLWTLGVWLLARDSVNDWRNLVSPPVLAAVLGFIFLGCGVQLPPVLSSVLEQLGAATTPLAMLVVGAQLQFAGANKSQWTLLGWLCFLRLLVVPLGVFYLLNLFALPKLLVQVATVITAMPASSMITIIAAQVDGDRKLASASTLVATSLAAVTLPLIIAVIA